MIGQGCFEGCCPLQPPDSLLGGELRNVLVDLVVAYSDFYWVVRRKSLLRTWTDSSHGVFASLCSLEPGFDPAGTERKCLAPLVSRKLQFSAEKGRGSRGPHGAASLFWVLALSWSV